MTRRSATDVTGCLQKLSGSMPLGLGVLQRIILAMIQIGWIVMPGILAMPLFPILIAQPVQ